MPTLITILIQLVIALPDIVMAVQKTMRAVEKGKKHETKSALSATIKTHIENMTAELKSKAPASDKTV